MCTIVSSKPKLLLGPLIVQCPQTLDPHNGTHLDQRGASESMDEILDDGREWWFKKSMKATLFALFTALLMVGCGEIENKKAIPVLTEQKEANENKGEVPNIEPVQSEGPLGDMDGDGIPNKDDSDPLGLNKGNDEGPLGDMDGDGIPNKDDSDPLGQK